MIGQKIEKQEKDMKDMTKEEIPEIFHIFKNMCDSFDKSQNSFGELYCISNIIIINHVFFEKGYKQLLSYINRFNTILKETQNLNYEWLSYAKEIIERINQKNIY